jgi:anaphase-promoting complex subunit 10
MSGTNSPVEQYGDNSPLQSASIIEIYPPVIDSKSELEEIACKDASWALSSAKPGNGIEQLLETNPETFWQSDGSQPHTITISFYRKTKISDIWLLFNYKADESYTPQQLSIRIGSSHHDLQEVQVVDLREPDGWVRIPLAVPPSTPERTVIRQGYASIRDKTFGGAFDFVRCFCIQVAVVSNHQNGRDTHIRNIRLFGPRVQRGITLAPVLHANILERIDRGIELITPEATSMTMIR